jgi:dihydrofolate reductase
MATLVFGMNLSLDGFVDHTAFAPDPVLFRHWIDQVAASAGSLYGRRLYEIMQYWDEDQPDWGPDERDFARAWRAMPKWVVSRSQRAVGPNATLIPADVEAAVRRLKDGHDGEIEVGGPVLAQWLGERGLIDVYRLYYHPVVLGRGTPFFAGPLPRLRLTATEPIGAEAVRLTCVPT